MPLNKTKSIFAGLVVLLIPLLLSACVSWGTTMIAEASEAVPTESVEVLISNRPECDFRVLAHIEIPGYYINRASLIRAFQTKAAKLGASAVEITYLQKVGAIEYMGSARAIRCLEFTSDEV